MREGKLKGQRSQGGRSGRQEACDGAQRRGCALCAAGCCTRCLRRGSRRPCWRTELSCCARSPSAPACPCFPVIALLVSALLIEVTHKGVGIVSHAWVICIKALAAGKGRGKQQSKPATERAMAAPADSKGKKARQPQKGPQQSHAIWSRAWGHMCTHEHDHGNVTVAAGIVSSTHCRVQGPAAGKGRGKQQGEPASAHQHLLKHEGTRQHAPGNVRCAAGDSLGVQQGCAAGGSAAEGVAQQDQGSRGRSAGESRCTRKRSGRQGQGVGRNGAGMSRKAKASQSKGSAKSRQRKAKAAQSKAKGAHSAQPAAASTAKGGVDREASAK